MVTLNFNNTIQYHLNLITPTSLRTQAKISKKSHNQLRMSNRDVRNGSHDSGNAALLDNIAMRRFSPTKYLAKHARFRYVSHQRAIKKHALFIVMSVK